MELEQAIREVQQPRSRFQIEHFVIGAHDTPEMRFHQIVLELSIAAPAYRIALINKRRQEREIERPRRRP